MDINLLLRMIFMSLVESQVSYEVDHYIQSICIYQRNHFHMQKMMFIGKVLHLCNDDGIILP